MIGRISATAALAACLLLGPAPGRAQAPEAGPCAPATADATADELARRLHVCARVVQMQAVQIAFLERVLADMLPAAVAPEATPPRSEGRR